MSDPRFEYGDRVRHAKRPEWGVGVVVKAEDVAIGGQPAQRLSVRFPGIQVKQLSTAHAALERVTEAPNGPAVETTTGDVTEWDRIGSDGWLAPVAQRKIEESMIRLPETARDPFAGLAARLASTLALYRFDRSGRGLIDWAVAQTGLEDPLARFNRHELEQYFDRWAAALDAHLGRLLQSAAGDRRLIDEVAAKAPAAGRDALRRAATAVR